MPMQPSPSAETSSPSCPSFLLSMQLCLLGWPLAQTARTIAPPGPSRGVLMRRLALLLTALLAATAVAAPALAAGNRIDVLQKFRKALPKVKRTSGIAVRLPATMKVDVKPKRGHGSGKAFKEGIYELDLGVGRNCNGGSACVVATFFGDKGGKTTNRIKVKLARGH